MRNGSLVISERDLETALSAKPWKRRQPEYCPTFLDSISDLEAEQNDLDAASPWWWRGDEDDWDPTDPDGLAMAA